MGVQSEQAELMGKVVTVHKVLRAKLEKMQEHKLNRYGYLKTWHSHRCKLFSGWIVGFTHRQEGKLYQTLNLEGVDSAFSASKIVPCVLISRWVNTKPIVIPIDGYTLGGTPCYGQKVQLPHTDRKIRQ